MDSVFEWSLDWLEDLFQMSLLQLFLAGFWKVAATPTPTTPNPNNNCVTVVAVVAVRLCRFV